MGINYILAEHLTLESWLAEWSPQQISFQNIKWTANTNIIQFETNWLYYCFNIYKLIIA